MWSSRGSLVYWNKCSPLDSAWALLLFLYFINGAYQDIVGREGFCYSCSQNVGGRIVRSSPPGGDLCDYVAIFVHSLSYKYQLCSRKSTIPT